jgi:hypothetical protein
MAEEFFFATLARVDQRHYRETGTVIQGMYIYKYALDFGHTTHV